MKYLIYLAQAHETFRKAELESLAELFQIKTDFSGYSEASPFVVVELKNDTEAQNLIKRSILTRAIYELWGQGKNDEELHQSVRTCTDESLWQKYLHSSFKFEFEGYQGSRTQEEQVKLMESFSYLGFQGKIRLKNSDEVFTVLDDFTSGTTYFTRLVQRSLRETNILSKYELKRRNYVGTTSFDAELSLVSCNIAHADKNRFFYDPFVGTGSFLVAAAEFGAFTFGSDIDIKTLIGKPGNKGKRNIKSNFKQYGTETLFMDVATMDFTHNALKSSFAIDVICCDPPYGVREGLKVLGTNKVERFKGKENIEIDGVKSFLRKDYVPTKKSFSLGEMLDELLQFAADRLVIGGRLVFWMPVANDEDYTTSIPHHKNLRLRHNCVQKFNKWSRRLLCYENMGKEYEGIEVKAGTALENEFRDRYYTGFRKVDKK